MCYNDCVSGAFVAGLDAGLIYNSFPKMGNKWIPDDILAFSPAIKNFTENPTTVQFDHRILGTATLLLISGLYLLSKRVVIPKRAYSAAAALGFLGWLQVHAHYFFFVINDFPNIVFAQFLVIENLRNHFKSTTFSGWTGYNYATNICSCSFCCSPSSWLLNFINVRYLANT